MHRQFRKRQTQTTNLLTAPSATGIDGETTVVSHSTGTKLAYNTVSTSTGTYSAPPLQFGGSAITVTTTSSQGTSASLGSSESTTGGSKSSAISISTVVAVCVGTFVAAGLLICLGVMVYRRSSRRPTRSRSAPRSAGHNRPPDTWKQLGDGQNQWDGKPLTEEKGGLQTPSNIPKQTPSHTTPVQDLSDPSNEAKPFSPYHPTLAEELAQPPKAFASHHQGLASWDGSTVVSAGAHDSHSLRSVRIESGTMSPSLNVAKVTPASTASGYHRWESAEVVVPDDYPTHRPIPVNPFADTQPQPLLRQKSNPNPFFGAQDVNTGRRQSQSRNPFSDHAAVEPVPRISHTQSDSVTSNSSSAYGADRAMQSLINALNLSPEAVEERLRIASMQPSEMSRYSVMTSESVYERESTMFPGPSQAQ